MEDMMDVYSAPLVGRTQKGTLNRVDSSRGARIVSPRGLKPRLRKVILDQSLWNG